MLTKDIKNILFPPIEEVTQDDNTFYVDSSVDLNLLAVLEDVKAGQIDSVTFNTLESILNKLILVKTLLGADKRQEIKKSGNYLISPK